MVKANKNKTKKPSSPWYHDPSNGRQPFDVVALMANKKRIDASVLCYIQRHHDEQRYKKSGYEKQARGIVEHFLQSTIRQLCLGNYEKRWGTVMELSMRDFHDPPCCEEDQLLRWVSEIRNLKDIAADVRRILLTEHNMQCRIGEKLLHPGVVMTRNGRVMDRAKLNEEEEHQRRDRDGVTGTGNGKQNENKNENASGGGGDDSDVPRVVRFLYVNWWDSDGTPSSDRESPTS